MTSNSSDSLKSKAVKGILWGSISNGVQQLLALIFGIYLGRMLTNHDYGMVGLLTVFATISSAIQEGGFISALANRKNIKHEDYNAVFWTSISISIALYVLLFCAAPYISSYFNEPELTSVARVLFTGLLFGSLGVTHSAYLFKNMKVKERSLAVTLGTFFSGITGITLVYMGYAYWGLVFQSVVYSFTFALICFLYSDFRPTLNFNFNPIKDLWHFSFKILLTNVINHINNNLLTLILGKSSITTAGNYSQAFKWSNMAQGVIANMSHGFAQPMLSTLEDDNERQKRIFNKLLNFIAFASFPGLALLHVLAEEFITVTVGINWLPSVPILKILCINAAFLPIINFYSNFLLSKGKSDLYMKFIVSFGFIQLAIIYFLYPLGVMPMVWGISFFTVFWTFMWQISVSKYAQLPYLQLFKILLYYFLAAAISASVAYFFGSLTDNLWGKSFLKGSSFLIAYLSILFASKSAVLLEIIQHLKNKYITK